MFKRTTRSTSYEDMSPRQVSELVDKLQERCDCMLSCVRVLCYLIKDFSLDLAEVNAEDFKSRIDDLVNTLSAADSTKTVQHAFDGGTKSIVSFIAREHEYLNEREAEFRGIIDLLRETLTSVLGENRTFTDQMQDQNVRIQNIMHLDDIRKIKETLKSEVTRMQETIQEKRASDARRIEVLSREVEVLRSSLEGFRDAAMTDTLTQVSNRLAFDTHFRHYVEQAEMQRRPLALLMCDVDDFRDFNTSLGHLMGDTALQVFAGRCKSVLRDLDMIARFGGDEFAVVLPNTSLQQALRVARRICAAVAASRYVCENKKGKAEFSLSASVGVAALRRHDTMDAVIERADQAMYAAKSAGKGCARSEKDIVKAA